MVRFYPTVEIAPGATVTGNPTTYSWTDLTQLRYVHDPAGITIHRGRGDRFSEASADTCALTLLNDGGRFVPKNPLGPWYGTLTRGTPLRVLIRPNTNSATDAFGRTVSNGWGTADTGGAWSVVGTAGDYAVSTTNGGRTTSTAANVQHVAVLSASVLRVDLTVRIRVNATSTGASQTAGVAFRYTGTNDFERAVIDFATTGAMTVRIVDRVGGVETPGTAVSTGLTHSTSSWYWLRLQTGQNSVRAKVWTYGTTEPATWQLDASVSALTIGTAGQFGCYSRRETGNTNASATTDFDDFAMVDGPRIQFTGFVDKWPVTWNDKGMAQAFAPITATGQLGRLDRILARRSAIYRACTQNIVPGTSTVVAYWPMEDGTKSTSFASGIGGAGQTFTGDVRPAGDTDVDGSDPLPTFSGVGSIRYPAPAYAASTTWAVRWLMKIPAGSFTAGAQVMSWVMPGGNPIIRWQLSLTPGSPDTLQLVGWSYTGASFSGTSVSFVDSTSGTSLADGRQLYFEVDGTQNGTGIDTTWNVWYVPDDGSTTAQATGLTQTAATSTNANITSIYHDAVTGFVTGGHTIGHVLLATDDTAGASSTGVDGGAGTLTGTRFGDVVDEQGVISLVGDLVRGVGATTQRLGVQDTLDPLTELKLLEATELGTLHDGKQGWIHLLPRSMKYNRPVDLTLDFSQGQVGEFGPVDDDYLLRNDVTVSNADGSSFRVTDSTSIGSQGVHPDRVTVNTYRDTDLQYQASWRKNVGTNDDLRYPALELNLTRNYLALADSWCNTDIGSRIQVTNLPVGDLPPDDLDLLVEGYTESISTTEWTATLNVSPARPWTVIELDDTSLARLAADGATLSTAVTSSATTLRVFTNNWQNTLFSKTSTPYDLAIGGEQVTATAVADGFGDTFTRSVSSGWGTASTGQSWTISGGSAADYTVTGSSGAMALTNTGVERTATVNATLGTDIDVVVFFVPTAVATGAAFQQSVRYRYGSGFYETAVQYRTTGQIDLYLVRTVTVLSTSASALAYNAASVIGVHVRAIGSTIQHRIWDAAVSAEPSTWTVTVTDTGVAGTSADALQIAAYRIVGNTNAGLTVQYDDFYSPNPQAVTVTRAVNGVSKAQTAGTAVQLWTPGRLAA